MNKIIEVKNLNVSYGSNKVLSDIDLSIGKGKLIGIIGPNGAGKSTLIKAILGLIPIDKGEIEISGQKIDKVRKKIAYVPQRSDIDWDFPITVKDTVLLGTYPRLGLFNRPKQKDRDLAMQSLKRVAMEEYSDNQIGELSGGQQQRVFVARALSQKAEYFFLDEPFVGIDISSEKVIMDILRDLRDRGKTIFVIHHDLRKVKDYFDDLILLNKEIIGAGPVNSVFKPELMEKAYKTPLSVLKTLGVSA